MDLGIRQALLQGLDHATATGRRVALRLKDKSVLIIQRDFVCYENHVEATDENGRVYKIPYQDIKAVDFTESETAPSASTIASKD